MTSDVFGGGIQGKPRPQTKKLCGAPHFCKDKPKFYEKIEKVIR